MEGWCHISKRSESWYSLVTYVTHTHSLQGHVVPYKATQRIIRVCKVSIKIVDYWKPLHIIMKVLTRLVDDLESHNIPFEIDVSKAKGL